MLRVSCPCQWVDWSFHDTGIHVSLQKVRVRRRTSFGGRKWRCIRVCTDRRGQQRWTAPWTTTGGARCSMYFENVGINPLHRRPGHPCLDGGSAIGPGKTPSFLFVGRISHVNLMPDQLGDRVWTEDGWKQTGGRRPRCPYEDLIGPL